MASPSRQLFNGKQKGGNLREKVRKYVFDQEKNWVSRTREIKHAFNQEKERLNKNKKKER